MLISAAGSRQGLRVRGFTLLETLVVLAIVSLMMVLVIPAIGSSLRPTLDDVARDVYRDLKLARNESIRYQRSVSFVVDVTEGSFRVGDKQRRQIPEHFSLSAHTATKTTQGGRAGIRFYPDGTSTGGRISVRSGEAVVVVNINWLTGRISTDTD